MVSLYQAVKPLLFTLDAENAHHLGMWTLGLGDLSPAACRAARATSLRGADTSTVVFGLHFQSAIGLAAGLDKDATSLVGLFALGFGFAEVGTVTPKPQPGNERPRLFRFPQEQAIINRFGFNNEGAGAMAGRLRELEWRGGPIGINVGKNKDTPNEAAHEDYLACIEALDFFADYLVLNISSPNTPGLRSLQAADPLKKLLTVVRRATNKPLLVKLSPDLSEHALDESVDVCQESNIDGFICTNTTLDRPFSTPGSHEAGGLSGAPLRERSNAVIRRVFRRTQGKKPIVGVGGVSAPGHVYDKICAGASLVQVYSALIYHGPSLPKVLHHGLHARLRAAEIENVAAAVGRNA
jgi:dihydroorotate dehydrogenase